MALDLGAWLSGLMAEKDDAGKPLYKPETLQDLLALILLTGKQPLEGLPDLLNQILGAFLLRSKLDPSKGAVELKKQLDAYFKKNPLPPALTQAFQREFQREPTGKRVTMSRPIRG